MGGLHVVVIGAGIVGVASALELMGDGHRVTLLDPGDPGGEQAASFGNGAWISPASVVPMSMPGLWRKLPSYLLDREGPLTIRWSHLPRLAPWLIRFLRAGSTVPRVEATARALGALLRDAPTRHAALAEAIGRPDLVRRMGLLYAYPDRAAFEAEALSWRLRRDNGIGWEELEAPALRERVPALAARYTFGAFVGEGAHCADPGAYVAAACAALLRAGAELRREEATGFELRGHRLAAVRTRGGAIPCERAVIAAGIGSVPLARRAGDRVPLESERGYHVVVEDPGLVLGTPIMPSDGKMANTTTLAGLRISGQVELASREAEPDWRRAAILLRHARATYPGLKADGRTTRWMGHRPSTPDGLPVIGLASGCPDIVHAFGHGHVGLAAGPMTGRLVGDIVAGRSFSIPLDPYAARRFA
jgi:D-amino-acid dehydrogenase